MFSQWTRYEDCFIPRTTEYYLVLGIRLAITDIRGLTKFGLVNKLGNEFLLLNNITNAWKAAYNLYGAVWYHMLESNQANKAKIKFVPFDDNNLDSESQTSEDEDSSETVDSEEEDEITNGSRFLGSVDSNYSWESAMSAASASLLTTTGPRLKQVCTAPTEREELRYSTIFKGILQTIVVSGRKAQEEAALNNFEEIVTAFFYLDKSATIFT